MSRKVYSRASSGKLLGVKSRYPESLRFLCLWVALKLTTVLQNIHFEALFFTRHFLYINLVSEFSGIFTEKCFSYFWSWLQYSEDTHWGGDNSIVDVVREGFNNPSHGNFPWKGYPPPPGPPRTRFSRKVRGNFLTEKGGTPPPPSTDSPLPKTEICLPKTTFFAQKTLF